MIVDDWRERAAALRDELVSVDKLSSSKLQEAVVNVPRHHFVPVFFEQQHPGSPEWVTVSRDDEATRPRWLEQVYSNVPLVTKLGDLALGSLDVTGPTSSSSAPGLMTRMIEILDLRPGHRVLEIGTGTGYNAGLLSYLLDDECVFSVDVDAELVDAARIRLDELGYHPALYVADGVEGLAVAAPYDRILATCAVSRVPRAWVEQITDDGMILVDVKVHASIGNLVLLRRDGDGLVGRFDDGAAAFMHMRTPAFYTVWGGRTNRDRNQAAPRMTSCTLERLWEIPPLWFLIHCGQPGRLEFGYSMNEETGEPDAVFFTSPDGSWCEVAPVKGAAPRAVWEAGPRRLWAELEHVIDQWAAADSPGWDRLGLTVTRNEQVVWLDEPDSPHTWRLENR